MNEPPPKKTRDGNSSSSSENTENAPNDKAKIPETTFNDLDHDCLETIFKFLSYEELLVVCDVSEFLRAIIEDLVIPYYLVDFNLKSKFSPKEIFSMFGRRMRRIKVTSSSKYAFEEFLILIITNCEPNRLVEVQLQCGITGANKDLLLRAVPYFSKIKKLVLTRMRNHRSAAYANLFKYMFAAPTHLEILNMYGYCLTKQWCRFRSLNNLVEFRIQCDKRSADRIEHLANFIATKVKLKLFSYIGDYNWTREIYAAIGNCKQLESFTQFNCGAGSSRHDNLTLQERNEFIKHLPRIKHLSFTSYASDGDDIYLMLSNLQEQKISLESLKIFIYDAGDAMNHVDLDDLHIASMQFLERMPQNAFESIKTVGIAISAVQSGSRKLFETNFMYTFLSKLTNLNSIRLMANRPISDIANILRHVPYLESFALYKTNFHQIPATIRRFKRGLETLDQQRDGKPLIHLFLDDIQYKEIEVIVF